MSLSYDLFIGAFLAKISEYEFVGMEEELRTDIVDGYLRRASAEFKKNCKYDLAASADHTARAFDIEADEEDIDELVDIISEGMLIQWMKPYLYRQENLQNVLNTRDYTTYSPAELLHRISSAYAKVQKDYTQMIREYSLNHNDLTVLHI